MFLALTVLNLKEVKMKNAKSCKLEPTIRKAKSGKTVRKYSFNSFPWLILLALVLVPMHPVSATAQNVETIQCLDGDVLPGSYADVIVNGTSCILDGATVNGSVFVSSGGTLTATGGTEVFGRIQVDSGGNIDLSDVTVLGSVTLKESNDVTVGSTTNIGSLKLEKSGAIVASGTIASIESKDSTGINLIGATIFPGSVSMKFANGSLVICGSTIEGVVNVVSTTGHVLAEASCGASTIDGSVAVEKGTGNVRFVGATLAAGDLNVIEQTGEVLVEDTSLSDLKVNKVTGNITLQNVITDSDTTIANNGGDVTINESMLGSDVGITSNGAVTITDNNFSLEDVMISNNSGPVFFDGNVNLSLRIIENIGVTVSGNTFTDAEVSKNIGGVSIEGNTGEKLNCSDNSLAPTGSGNTITELTDGQCAGF